MAASIDVVIPAYNNYKLTDDCLEHLARQTIGHHTIVVDNGSSDGTGERLRVDWPGVTVVSLPENVGFTAAANRGVKSGEGEIVVLLNNDVQLRPDCLERLTAPLLAEPELGSTAALMLAPGEQTIDSLGVTVDPTLAAFARLQGLPTAAAANAPTAPAGDHLQRLPAAVANASTEADVHASISATYDRQPVLAGPEGTTAAYRRSAWEQVGGLDEAMRAYMEIVDLALRLRGAGWQTRAVPEAVGVHLGSRTYGRRTAEQRRLAGFSRGYLLRRYGVLWGRAAPRALVTEAIVVAGDLALCHDVEALRGRLAGWRAARGLPRREWPPTEAIDSSIGLSRSLRMRRGAVTGS